MLDLLGFLEPQVLRSDRATFKWLVATLQGTVKPRVASGGGIFTIEDGELNDCMWNTGLAAWNERCEAQRLQLRSSGDEGHEVTLEATLDKQIRGCFVSCGWSSAEQLQPDQTDAWPGATPHHPWNPSVNAWWSVTSHDIFHAVYHDSSVGRVQWPAPRFGWLYELAGNLRARARAGVIFFPLLIRP